MPRLTNQLYLDRRQFLRRMWRDFPQLYSILLPQAQWRVHSYYQTQVEADDASLLDGRVALTAGQPSLAQAASKSFHRLYFGFRVAFEYAQGNEIQFNLAVGQLSRSRTPCRRDVEMRGVMRPEVDADEFVGVLLLLTESNAPDDDIA